MRWFVTIVALSLACAPAMSAPARHPTVCLALTWSNLSGTDARLPTLLELVDAAPATDELPVYPAPTTPLFQARLVWLDDTTLALEGVWHRTHYGVFVDFWDPVRLQIFGSQHHVSGHALSPSLGERVDTVDGVPVRMIGGGDLEGQRVRCSAVGAA